MSSAIQDKRQRFRDMHEGPGAFIIGNCWDVGSARVLAGLGYAAIATSSGAFANTLGRRDGGISREQAIGHAADVVAAVDVPVSADLENGFGDAPEHAAVTVRRAAEVGLAGCSIEDARPDPDRPIYDRDEAVERVAAAVEAARAAVGAFTLTARAENFIRGVTDLDDTIARLKAYEAAGADVLMAPGLPDLEAVARVCEALEKPFSFMVGMPGRSFPKADLEAAGVRRISLATSLYRAAMGGFLAAAQEARAGTFGFVETGMPGRDLAGYMQG